MCYAESTKIISYLNQPHIRTLLGVDPAAGNYSTSSEKVARDFERHLDKYSAKAQDYVSQLLERGVKFLIYAGEPSLLVFLPIVIDWAEH